MKWFENIPNWAAYAGIATVIFICLWVGEEYPAFWRYAIFFALAFLFVGYVKSKMELADTRRELDSMKRLMKRINDETDGKYMELYLDL